MTIKIPEPREPGDEEQSTPETLLPLHQCAEMTDPKYIERMEMADQLVIELHQQLRRLRTDSLVSLTAWVRAAAEGKGGRIVWQAPCQRKKRRLGEVAYATESWFDIEEGFGRNATR